MKNKIKKLLCAWMAFALAIISSGVFSIQISAATGDIDIGDSHVVIGDDIHLTVGEGDVVINEANFPDAELCKILNNLDPNKDGKFSDAELRNLTEITIEGNVADLTGLKLLKYVEKLIITKTQVTIIGAPESAYQSDVLNLPPDVKEIKILDNENLEFVNFGDIMHSMFEPPKLTSLDVSNNPKLTRLLCCGNELSSLNVSNNTSLKEISCYDNQLTSLDVSSNTNLDWINCGRNKLTNLNISKNTELTGINSEGNQLTSLDVSKNTKLYWLNLDDNQLTSLDVSKNTALSNILCYNNHLTSIDISNIAEISQLNFRENVYPIGKDATYYNLSRLPNFDPSKASNWNGATYDEATNIISNFTSSDKITYKYDIGKNISETFTLSLTDTITPPAIIPADKTDELNPGSPEGGKTLGYVWANGKDIKDNKKTTENEEKRYKTWVFEIARMSLGGKLNVLVTDEKTMSVEDFLKLFTNGKLNSAGKAMTAKTKPMATAKIKDGTVTVTAGKKPGIVNIWIYEVKNKEVISDSVRRVQPDFVQAEVFTAPSKLCFAEVGDIVKGALSSGKKAVTKVTVPYKVGAARQDEVSIAFGDKKAAYDPKAGFKLENSNKSVAEAWFYDQNTIKILPAKVGKAKITLKNIQSSKTAKLTVTVANYYKVTFPAGVTVSYKSGKDTKTIKSGDYVPDKAKLTISGSGTIKVNGSDIKKGSYKVSGKEVNITVSSAE